MQLNLKPGEVKLMTVQNETINGLQFTFIQRGLINEAFMEANTKEVGVKLILERNGKSTTLANETLYDMMCFTRFYSGADKATALQQVKMGADTTLLVVSSQIDLTGNLHLKGDDRLHVEVDFSTEALKAGFDQALSYLQVATKESIGYEYFIPIFRSYVVSANEPSVIRQLGNNVAMIGFISHEDEPHWIAKDPTKNILSNFQISSDKFKCRDDRYQLLAKRLEQFQGKTTAEARFQSFIMVDTKVPLNEVEVELHFSSENVGAGRNRLMYVLHETSQAILAKAAAQEEIHSIENAQAVGVKITPQMQAAKAQAETVKNLALNAQI